ncbi:MAG: ribonuclease P protein component [Actinomycetota bacterium]
MTTALDRDASAAAGGRLWRVSTRAELEALRRSRLRGRVGSLAVTWLPPAPGSAGPPRAAFAVGRSAGGAVVRNRIRRRLRAALRLLQADGRLPAGSYLIGAGADVAEQPWPELVTALSAALEGATQGGSRS